VLPGISAKSTSHCGWVRLLFQLLDLLPLADRLAMHRVLKPFDHCFKMLEAYFNGVETLRYARFLSTRSRAHARARGLPTRGSSPFEPRSEASRPQSWR
jgi:hypothetical protein